MSRATERAIGVVVVGASVGIASALVLAYSLAEEPTTLDKVTGAIGGAAVALAALLLNEQIIRGRAARRGRR